MRIIGDIHGKTAAYAEIAQRTEKSLQVGDFGIGFRGVNYPKELDPKSHKFIRGNHDAYPQCKKVPAFIDDGTMWNGIFCIGGASSIDKAFRVEGVSWWADEEIGHVASLFVSKDYENLKPDIVVSHDAPLVATFACGNNGKIAPSFTQKLLDSLFEIHKPRLWVHGHWHTNSQKTIRGCEFVCLAELSFIDV
jgi:hypothetical protein